MIPLVPWKWRCLLKTSFLVIFISNLLKNLLESFLSSRQLHINLVWPECVHVDATLWIYWGWKRWCYFLWTTFAPNWSNFSIFNIFNILSYIKYMTHFVKTSYNKESIHQKLFVFAERGRFRSAKRLQRILWQPGCARWQGDRTEAELRKPKTFSDLKV